MQMDNKETLSDLKLRMDKLWNDIVALGEEYWDVYDLVFSDTHLKNGTAGIAGTEEEIPF
jgi:hypothetical protein